MTLVTFFTKTMSTFSIVHTALLVVGLCLFLPSTEAKRLNSDRDIIIINKSGGPIELYWINPENDERDLIDDDGELETNGSRLPVSSFVGDEFEIHEKEDPDTGVCGSEDSAGNCRFATFAVKQDVNEQKFFIRSDFTVDNGEEIQPKKKKKKSEKQRASTLPPQDEDNRDISIINDSGEKLKLFWIDPDSGKRDLVEAFELNTLDRTLNLNSHAGDVFEAQEMSATDTDLCGTENSKDQSCRTATFTVQNMVQSYEQQFFIRSNFTVDGLATKKNDTTTENYEDLVYVRVPSIKVAETLRPPGPRSKCQDQAKAALDIILRKTTIESSVASLVMAEYASCVEANLTGELMDTNEHLRFLSNTLDLSKDYFENYTCADFNLTTTAPIRNVIWTDKDTNYNIGILHEREHSKIHLLSDFITDEECQAMEDAANPILQVAVVDDGKGGSEVSKHRKALQAGIKVAWDKEEEGDLIARLSRRVYDYANHVLPGLNIRENGQEDLMSIQYAGRGKNDTEPDQYLPHCDGACAGLPHRYGSRVATMVLYCTIPTQGGATNFRKSGVHIEPKKNDGTFFSYMGVDDLVMDNGFTEHSGCPVVEGEKKIVTQWIRYGVDDERTGYSLGFS